MEIGNDRARLAVVIMIFHTHRKTHTPSVAPGLFLEENKTSTVPYSMSAFTHPPPPLLILHPRQTHLTRLSPYYRGCRYRANQHRDSGKQEAGALTTLQSANDFIGPHTHTHIHTHTNTHTQCLSTLFTVSSLSPPVPMETRHRDSRRDWSKANTLHK